MSMNTCAHQMTLWRQVYRHSIPDRSDNNNHLTESSYHYFLSANKPINMCPNGIHVFDFIKLRFPFTSFSLWVPLKGLHSVISSTHVFPHHLICCNLFMIGWIYQVGFYVMQSETNHSELPSKTCMVDYSVTIHCFPLCLW